MSNYKWQMSNFLGFYLVFFFFFSQLHSVVLENDSEVVAAGSSVQVKHIH